jgi:hypothetical protein
MFRRLVQIEVNFQGIWSACSKGGSGVFDFSLVELHRAFEVVEFDDFVDGWDLLVHGVIK